MHTTSLSLNTTHHYGQGWKHLDAWIDLGPVKLTAARVIERADGYERGPTTVQRARVRPGLDPRLVEQALVDTLGGSSCQHEFDCCGCANRSVQVRKLSRRDFAIRTSVRFNF